MPKISHSPKLSDAALELIAARFRALSEPTRLKLLMALEDGEKNVTELVNLTGAILTGVKFDDYTLKNAGKNDKLLIRSRMTS